MMDIDQRPEYFTCHIGPKEVLPFSAAEYDRRLASLRAIMTRRDIPVVLLTSVHNIAYYTGFSPQRSPRRPAVHAGSEMRPRPPVGARPKNPANLVPSMFIGHLPPGGNIWSWLALLADK